MKEAPQMSHKTWTGTSLIKTRLHVNTVLFNPHTHPMRKKSDRKIAQDYMLVSGRARPYTSVWFPQTPSPSTIFVGRNRIQMASVYIHSLLIHFHTQTTLQTESSDWGGKWVSLRKGLINWPQMKTVTLPQVASETQGCLAGLLETG